MHSPPCAVDTAAAAAPAPFLPPLRHTLPAALALALALYLFSGPRRLQHSPEFSGPRRLQHSPDMNLSPLPRCAALRRLNVRALSPVTLLSFQTPHMRIAVPTNAGALPHPSHGRPPFSLLCRTRAERRYMVDFNESEGESAFLVVRSTKGVWFDNPHVFHRSLAKVPISFCFAEGAQVQTELGPTASVKVGGYFASRAEYEEWYQRRRASLTLPPSLGAEVRTFTPGSALSLR